MSEFYIAHDGTLVPGTELEMLRARLAEAERNAARYRFLKAVGVSASDYYLGMADPDDAIDAAMAGDKP